MQLFRDSNIQFMKYRKFWMLFSVAMLVASCLIVFVFEKLNMGIDFAGGTQLTLKFSEPVEVQYLRDIVAGAGVPDASIQRFGVAGSNEALIKTSTIEGSEEGSQEQVVAALDEALGNQGAGIDLNRVGPDPIESLLKSRDPDGLVNANAEIAGLVDQQPYAPVVDAILELRRERGMIVDWESIAALSEVTPGVAQVLQAEAHLGKFSILGAENVGPQIGSELRQKGILAVVFSMIGMLIYIWFRFELRFGIGAMIATLHDVFITVGLYALAGFEFNLTTIAAFLTLVGYSVNDTVVVFDRVRENLRRSRSMPLEEVMNQSLNQTLSRTALTSGTTLLVVGAILFLGGDVLRGFAFILTVGVIVGTYSSIYIASPFTMLWESTFGRAARTRRREAKSASA